MAIPVPTQVHPTFGVQLTGVDTTRALDRGEVEEIRALLDAHQLILFRGGPTLEPEQQLRFVSSFGVPEALPASSQPGRGQAVAPGFPQVFRTTNTSTEAGALNAGTEGWHNDGLYREVPTDVIGYHLVKVPEVGGNTLFANGFLAYESLPPSLKAKLDGAKAVHGRGWQGNAVHTMVREHPRTKRKALFLALGLADRTREDSTPGTLAVIGWPDSEMREIFAILDEHLSKPEIMYRHRWQPGDLLLTDNASVLHRGEMTDPRYPRILHRVSIIGTPDLNVLHAFKPMAAQR